MTTLKTWYPVASIIVLMTALQWVGPELLRYETDAIDKYEFWRLLSGHWVHANWMHFFLNMTGLLLCFALTHIRWNTGQWGWRILILSTGISAGFYTLHPNIGWYVGFSGVLFGLYVLAAVASLSRQIFISSMLLAFIALKIGLEQWSTVKISSSELIGVPVLVDAHFYGVLMAILVLVVQMIWNRFYR